MSETKPRKVGSRAARTTVPGPGRPKDLTKRKAILEAAKRLFPRYGYDRISMDAIAAEAGVSKLTVYSHFKDKDALFAAAVKARCEEQLPSRAFAMPTAAVPIATVLTTIAERFHALACSPDAMEMYRTMAARAPAGDNLAQIFFDAGPKRTIDALEQLLRKAHRAGKLNAPEPRTSAEHFFILVKGLAHMRALIGCADLPKDEEAAAHIASAVDLFMRAHLPVAAPTPAPRKPARQRSS